MIVVVTLKNADGVQNTYLRGTIFFKYKRLKWGTVPPNGVRLATLIERYPKAKILAYIPGIIY